MLTVFITYHYFLGLRNLDIITDTLKEIQKSKGINIDIERIPFEENVFTKIFATGKTNSVFQFESGGMKKMLRQFKPSCIEDIILLNAAYRPGPMQYLEDIIAVKHGRKKPSYVIPEMETILGTTYGYPVYQEQIMQIFNKFAGFTLGESDIIRRLMSKKKVAEFQKYKEKFIEGLVERGAIRENAEHFWNELEKFSLYAFNKSHATAYSIVAYYTAWLKYHYPAEYFASVMNSTEFDKLGALISEAREFGVKILPANIQTSGERFNVLNGDILVGLGLIKGVANSASVIIKERNLNKFESFNDFVLRVKIGKDVLENLIYAGAFDKFTKNRGALVEAIPEYADLIKKIRAKETIVEGLIDATSEKEIAKRDRAIDALELLKVALSNVSVNTDGVEDVLLRLAKEKEVVGTFVSGHPLDSYGRPEDFKCCSIADLNANENTSIMGMIKNLRVVQRKTDGKNLAFFTLEDRTGEIAVNCFTYAYSQFASLIQEGAVVIINGDTIEDEDNMSDETILKINVKTVKLLETKKKYIVIKMNNVSEWEDIKERIKPFRVKSGYNIVVFDDLYKKYRRTTIYVTPEIMELTDLEPKIV